jgi:hypothetical protein
MYKESSSSWWRSQCLDDHNIENEGCYGIGLMIDGDLMGGETNACATYANSKLTMTKNRSSSHHASCFNDNEYGFHALEAWTLTPCHSIKAVDEMELHRIFVEKHYMFAA